jgi:hypothetical protein
VMESMLSNCKMVYFILGLTMLVLGGCATDDVDMTDQEELATARQGIFQSVCQTGTCTQTGLNCKQVSVDRNNIITSDSYAVYGYTPCSDAWTWNLTTLNIEGDASVSIYPTSWASNRDRCVNTTITWTVYVKDGSSWLAIQPKGRVSGSWDGANCNFGASTSIGRYPYKTIRISAQAKYSDGTLKPITAEIYGGFFMQ